MDVILLVLAVVAVFLALAALGGGAKNGNAGVGGLAAFFFLLVAGGLAFLAFSYRLGPNEIGLTITAGRIGEVSGPGGWHNKAPWTNVEKLNALPYTVDPVDLKMTTKDGGEFSARFNTRWHTDAANAKKLYTQRRTDDEAEISKYLVTPTLNTLAGDYSKTLGNPDIISTSVLDFAGAVKTKAAPMLLEKYGIILDDVFIDGRLNPSEKLQTWLNNQAAAVAETNVATQRVKTAEENAKAAKQNAIGASQALANLPANATPQQVAMYCANLWADAVSEATKNKVPLYTTPCGTAGVSTVVQSK